MNQPNEQLPDETTDLLIFGAGAAGMTAALVASLEGLDVRLCEKSGVVGGTTSTSAGTVWIPASHQSERDNIPDSRSAAEAYLEAVVGPADEVREAFLDTGPDVLDYLESRTDVQFVAAKIHPDYLGNQPGAAYGGRALGPPQFDGRLLGKDFERIRPPKPEFMILGGLMVTRADIPSLLKPFSSISSLRHVMSLVLRYAVDRMTRSRGTRLVMGNALVARFLSSLKKQNVAIDYDTALRELIVENDIVVGAVVEHEGVKRSIRARKGVILATGGLGWSKELRERFFPAATRAISLAPESVAGDGVSAAEKIGAQIDARLRSPGLWMPCSVLRKRDGTESVFPHIVLDRARPGLLAVNATGRRFVNEANSYHDFCDTMLRTDSVPAHLICDRSFIRDYGIGLVHPGTRNLSSFIEAGYLVEGADARQLASKLSVDPDALEDTIKRYNAYSLTGTDEEFGRGTTDVNRVNGDPDNHPNPCLRPLSDGPLYAVTVRPADLASSLGLRTDKDACVLDADGEVVPGLYACGNDSVSIFGGTYPGPGTTLGPAIVFGYRAVMRAKRDELH
ncbi:FAD-dependent oxidoreductase [Agrobacterium vitis]|uniref:FAD-dependent oxidoreductase n=1 Tax=Agrobacterium vitis TaxID=373 RepID=UPI0012E85B75|nr:FAD-dependent oxidoreductase [Agrobacterium vitis]MVA22042.1 FAD-dependent oxidoreductase [Agrobacterium vitis]